jgi:hypothetical protein
VIRFYLQMNPGNYLPATGLMNNGGQAGLMDPYGQGIPAGYNNAAQLQGAFQAMQMPNQSTPPLQYTPQPPETHFEFASGAPVQYPNMRASGSIPQRYAQAPQQPNTMMGGMGQPPVRLLILSCIQCCLLTFIDFFFFE